TRPRSSTCISTASSSGVRSSAVGANGERRYQRNSTKVRIEMALESETDAMQRGYLPLASLTCLVLMITACSIGPQYQRPEVWVPAAYKESPPPSFKAADGWKAAQPSDDVSRGQWWAVFQDPALNALEAQVDISNQTLAVAEAQLRGARAA